jgi:ribokinase
VSRLLADLLGNDHPLFTFNLSELEKASGRAGIDVRLIGDITTQDHAIMRQIGVDPSDTSAEELYHALNSVIGGEKQSLLTNTSYLLISFKEGPVSFNLLDVLDNAEQKIPFSERRVDHAQRHLRAEVVRRYADHDRTSNDIVRRLAEQIGLWREIDQNPTESDNQPKGENMEDNTNRETPSLLMIGDIFTDAFIKLADESAKIIKEEDGKEWLALPFGQKPPYDHVDIVKSVGPSPNAAVSASRLGLNASLMAWVGGDEVGKEALEHLRGERVGTESMVVEQDKLTSYWYVLRYGADRTMLVKSEKYSYEWQAPEKTPDWIYLSYIGADSWPLHEQLIGYLHENPSVKLAFQPGTFHFKWGSEKLAGIYGRSEIVVMNREEAVDVTGAGYDDLHALANAFHAMGPKIVVITDGPKGSYASYDGRLVTIPNFPDPVEPLDRTGAGDAFASTIVSALALGKTMDEALTWAPINSMSVVQHIGAQAGLVKQEDIQRYLPEAPENYVVTDI